MPSMTAERSYFDMIYLQGKIYAVGGSGLRYTDTLNSMEIFDPPTRTWTKQSIPFSIEQHCITQLSANQFILIGGEDGTGYEGVSKNVMTKDISIQKLHFLRITAQIIFRTLFFKFQTQNKTWIYDVTTNIWMSGPRLSIARTGFGCFHIKDNNEITKIVVMGGYEAARIARRLTSVEVLDINTMTWGIGPSLPLMESDNKGIQSVSDPYLGFSTGGANNGRLAGIIYGFKKTGEDVYTWEEVHSMTRGRSGHSIVNAPKRLLPNC